MPVSGMKVVGWLMIVGSLLKVAIDIFDGNGFDISSHYEEVMGALAGAGFIRTKKAIENRIP